MYHVRVFFLKKFFEYIAVELTVTEEAKNFEGTSEGLISLQIESRSSNGMTTLTSEVKFYVKAKIIPTPVRQQRLLWDQFHNLRYPSGYFPRDDLKQKNEPLDWHADHIHTNFKGNQRNKAIFFIP